MMNLNMFEISEGNPSLAPNLCSNPKKDSEFIKVPLRKGRKNYTF